MSATAPALRGIDAEGQAARLHEPFADRAQQFDAAKLGMWAFLATEILLFGALFCAYFFYRFALPDGFAAASRRTDALLGAIETGVLLSSSLGMALAIRAVRLGQRRAVTWLLAATIACGAAFLAIHAHEYVHEAHAHLWPGAHFDSELGAVPGARLFYVLYFALTGLHGVHVAIGIALLGVLALANARAHFAPDDYTPLELGGLYWHLVDIVWIFLYPLFYLVART